MSDTSEPLDLGELVHSEHVELGDRVKDKVTGFTGIAIGRTDWLYGCTRISVLPEHLHDGKPIDAHSFDEPQLEILARGVISTPKSGPTPLVDVTAPGGPRPEPTRQPDARR